MLQNLLKVINTIAKKSLMVLFFCLCFVIAETAPLSAENTDDGIMIKAGVTPEKVTTGVPLKYRISITGRGALNVKIKLPEEKTFFPAVKKEKQNLKKKGDKKNDGDDPSRFIPLYVIQSAKKQDFSKDNTEYLSVIMDICYYRPGTYSLPEVDFTGPDGVKIGYRVPTVTVEETNKEGNLQQIEPPLDLGGNYNRLFAVIGITVLLTLACVFLYRYIKKRKENKLKAVPAVPPIELFRKEFAGIKGRKLIEEGKTEEYVVKVSTVFRAYLSRRFNIDAAEMTTDELSDKLPLALKIENLEGKSDEIISCFNLWDLSKFAEFTPSKEVLLANLEAAEQLAEKLSSQSGESVNGSL